MFDALIAVCAILLIGIIAVTVYCIKMRKNANKSKVSNTSDFDSERGTIEDPKATGRF